MLFNRFDLPTDYADINVHRATIAAHTCWFLCSRDAWQDFSHALLLAAKPARAPISLTPGDRLLSCAAGGLRGSTGATLQTYLRNRGTLSPLHAPGDGKIGGPAFLSRQSNTTTKHATLNRGPACWFRLVRINGLSFRMPHPYCQPLYRYLITPTRCATPVFPLQRYGTCCRPAPDVGATIPITRARVEPPWLVRDWRTPCRRPSASAVALCGRMGTAHDVGTRTNEPQTRTDVGRQPVMCCSVAGHHLYPSNSRQQRQDMT